jgi:hypothetical protein
MSASEPGWHDDDRLLADLGDAVRSASEVPPSFVQVGRGAFAWHGIDLELATLAYDSDVSGVPVGVRSRSGGVRSLTFEGAGLTLEVELSADALGGQVVPPRPGTVEVWVDDELASETAVDDAGWFHVAPPPARPFRLCVRTGDDTVVTSRVTP